MPTNGHTPFATQPLMEAFLPLAHFFQGLRLKGPHWKPATLRALALCDLPTSPRVADLGCGAGASALILARELGVPILALDAYGPFLDELCAHAEAEGLRPFLEPVSGDMGAPPIDPGSLDLLWCEGAIYQLGWTEGLRRWASLLKPGAFLCATELCWFVPEPDPELLEAFSAWFPGVEVRFHVRTEQRLQEAQAGGYRVLEHFPLPAQAWLDYYAPLRTRIQARPQDPIALEMASEIDLYDRLGAQYGYVFFVLRRD